MVTGTAPAPVYRRFIDLPAGQTHYREAGRERTGCLPLVLLHQASGSSRTMVPLMRRIGGERPVIAPDLPGNGDSAPPETDSPAMADYARSVARMLDAAGLDEVAVYGFHAGACVAAELAVLRPGQVKAVILDSMGLYDPAEAAAFADRYVPVIDKHKHGLHLIEAWNFVRDTYLFWPWFRTDADHARGVGLPPLEEMHDKVVEVIKSMQHFGAYYRAAFMHDKAAVLPQIGCPTLVTAGRDNSQAGHVPTIAAMIAGAESLITAGVYTPQTAEATAGEYARWLSRLDG
ncbi:MULTISPECIES: alpha/beta hydrolase [unclassified Roseitalea]|uniref:alpha/beta hydrolase n=1 Tax=unclassified Roseitalea TaxID=2639107 RepID=UPI00273E9BFE|nr:MULTISPECIES: alpha/beta hydrolase [unclassified Roseitalea]